MTPRLNPEVNSYWMCDIGRFDYHWVESERRLRQPHLRRGQSFDAAPWTDALVAVKMAVDAAGGPSAVRFFVSAHASLEELFVLKHVSTGTGGVTLGWRHRDKPQPKGVKFKIPAIDAPNVRGARDLGFDVGSGTGPADVSALRAAVEAGQVTMRYVLDSGPDGSIGDTDWILAARRAGKIKTLVVQGVPLKPFGRLMGQDASGTIDATAELDGPASAAAGHVTLRGHGLKFMGLGSTAAQLPPLELELALAPAAGQLQLNGKISARDDQLIAATGTVPLLLSARPLAVAVPQQGRLDLHLAGDGKLEKLAQILPMGEDRITGDYRVALAAGGGRVVRADGDGDGPRCHGLRSG